VPEVVSKFEIMTEKQLAYKLRLQFSLLKNKDLYYVADNKTMTQASIICLEELKSLARLSSSPYYSVEYYDRVIELVKEYEEKPEELIKPVHL
jgi:hypothetical protein